jgi:hypothetical protein
VTDSAQSVANTTVRLYQKDEDENTIDATPKVTGVTDAIGRFLLPNRPVVGVTTATGLTLSNNPWDTVDLVGRNGLFLAEVVTPSGSRWGWPCLWQANVELARGNQLVGVLPVAVTS